MTEALRSTGVHKIGGKNMVRMDDILNLTRILRDARERIVFVVSAFEDVTNALIAALDRLNETDYEESGIDQAFTQVKELHCAVISEHFTGDFAGRAQTQYQQEYERTRTALLDHKTQGSTRLTPEPGSYKIRDEVIGMGERLGATFLKIFLEQNGCEARSFENAACDSVKLNGDSVSSEALEEAIQNGLLRAALEAGEIRDDVIRIFSGHIRGTPRGNIPHEGRNYTDGRAGDVAIALRKKGEKIEEVIYEKDEPGVRTANPKELEDKNAAQIHGQISYIEGSEMAAAGSGLMTAGILSRARRNRLRLVLRDIRQPTSDIKTVYSGTEVCTERVFKTIVSNEHVDGITMNIPEMADHHGFTAVITSAFSRHGISYMGSTEEGTSITFYIPTPPDKADRKECRKRIEKALDELREVEIEGNRYRIHSPRWSQGAFAAVSVIGHELKKQKDTSIISGVLAAFGINVHATNFGDPKTRMFFVVKKEESLRAVRLLHRIFVEGDIATIEEYRRLHAAMVQAATTTYKS